MPRTREDQSLIARLLRTKPPLFWWFLANTLALCLAILSWIFFLHVFGSPHISRNYKILEKLDRLQPIQDFDPLSTPTGDAHNPTTLYKKYYSLSDDHLTLLNHELKKNYIGNFKDSRLTTYIQGSFRVLQARKLGADDLVTQGIAIQLQSLVSPDQFHPPTPYLVLLELILPNAPESALQSFQAGDQIELQKNPNFFAVIHTVRQNRSGDEPLISLSAIPLVYSAVAPSSGKSVPISPPDRLNLSGTFPIFTKH